MTKLTRIHSIDYLKALCILMVIFTHYDWTDKTNVFFTLIIAMAVPIFMVLTGYNFTMSYTKKTNGTLHELYSSDMLIPRLWRFILPFTLLYIPEMILHPIILDEHFSPLEWLRYFFRGGLGPGSYYVPVLIVLLFTFPLIYICVRRFSGRGVCIVALCNLFYEIFAEVLSMDSDTYRLLFFRYLLYVALGCYLYFHTQEKKRYPLPAWILGIMFVTGLSFSVAVYQFEIEPPIFRQWTKTSMPLALYIFPIIYVIMRLTGTKQISGKIGEMLAKIGQASYHIFLVQMIYYRLFDHLLLPARPAIPVVCADIIICVVLGYGYYLLEGQISQWISGCPKRFERIYYRMIRLQRRVFPTN